MQVYGVLDVQRVAGNFHLSVHGLNIYVAQMVSSFFSCVMAISYDMEKKPRIDMNLTTFFFSCS